MPSEPRIAVVGLGGLFPGASTLEQFWANVVGGVDCSRDVPPGRWLLDSNDVVADGIAVPDRVYTKRGYYLDHISIPTEGLDVDAKWLARLDAVVHLILHAGRQAFAEAATPGLDRSRAGVILGHIALPTEKASALTLDILGRTFAEQLGLASEPGDTDPLNRHVVGLPAGILAKALGLAAGSLTLDAACASSLFALKLACDELRAGRADLMLAGGAARPDCLYTQMGFCQLRALSPSGRCSPFDAAGDGLLVGEGCGVLGLKRLDDALRDGNTIYGVIAGIGLSNDVDGNLLAPASEGQLRAMRDAYKQANWSPGDVDLIECHATGTLVGDAVEFASLRELWRQQKSRTGACVIGSVKSTVGHLLTGAGAAGLIKVLLAMKHGALPPTANFRSPAKQIELDSSPFRILRAAEPWERRDHSTPRRAAVSGFGFGGTNAHALIEEHLPEPPPAQIVVPPRSSSEPIAVVGMDARFGPWQSLRSFQQRVLTNDKSIGPAPKRHAWGVESADWFRDSGHKMAELSGWFIEELEIPLNQFRIPPKELEEMLPQQLLALQVAAAALADAPGWEMHRSAAGVFLGLGLELNTTDFHLRWWALEAGRKWRRQQGGQFDEREFTEWISQLREAAHPPLSANRTMGALGSIAASRIARAFQFGGPSFTLCSEESSGGRALEMAVRALQRGEIDLALAGAVDLAGDVRRLLNRRRGGLAGEGAAAVVLKRQSDARRDGDRVYAVIRGVGVVGGGDVGDVAPTEDACRRALQRACADANTPLQTLDFVDRGAEDVIGHSGAASFMASFVRSCSALHEEVLPATTTGKRPQLWLSNEAQAPRSAAVTATSVDGNCVCAVVEEFRSKKRTENQATAPPARASGPTLKVIVGGKPFVIPPLPGRRAGSVSDRSLERFGPSVAQHPGAAVVAAHSAIAEAHAEYLRFQDAGVELLTRILAFSNQLTAHALASPDADQPQVVAKRPLLDTEQCREYAIGSIARVLGPEFASVDAHPTRVRLPDGPLMLVDHVWSIDGKPGSLTSGRLVTDHLVHEQRWYIAEGHIPPGVCIEAGQADLLLSGYLGIDFVTKGLAVYRLLDAAVTFHRSLPRPGELVRYEIHIDRFFRQGETHLFRFRFEGTVNGEPLLTMRDGCAGFFTAKELAAGKGVVQTALDRRPLPGKRPDDWHELAPMAGIERYDEMRLAALRAGDLAACFGPAFANLPPKRPLTLPDGMLKLIDRVVELDPAGGRFALGRIRAELDIHPDDWFLTCHFIDDMVMPGTLMYECCLHTLRVFLLRLGWLGESGRVAFEPVPGIASQLKCRGQVIATTKVVTYEVSIKELGYRPEPFAIADALMYADGKPIVEITSMSLRLAGTTREEVERWWMRQSASRVLFDRESILAFAVDKPSLAFGEHYRPFDSGRFIARLPGPPYSFIDRIVEVRNCEQWKLAAGAESVAEYDVPPAGEWYFTANRQPSMPFAVLLEVALQACGWLAAYLGSALTSDADLHFRNLGGTATAHGPVEPDIGTLTTAVKLTNVSRSAGMIIQSYDVRVTAAGRPIYTGQTTFGFFSKSALEQQVGIRDAMPFEPGAEQRAGALSFPMPDAAPFPMPMLRMIDDIDVFIPNGGSRGLGFIRGTKRVNPEEWFFKAHFFQDPVWPGSLGLEAFLQLLQVIAVRRWGPPRKRYTFVPARPHTWTYRGQVVPTNKLVTVEANVTNVDEARRILTADGYLAVDGRVIYRMIDFTLLG